MSVTRNIVLSLAILISFYMYVESSENEAFSNSNFEFENAGAYGGYMYTVGILEMLSNSECGHLVKEPISYSEAMRDALRHFDEVDREKAYLAATSKEMKHALKQSFEQFLELNPHPDKETNCKIMLDIARSNYQDAKLEWEDAIRKVEQ